MPPAPPPSAQGTPGPAVVPSTQGAPLTPAGLPAPTPQMARPIPPAPPGAGFVPQSAQGQPLRRMDDLRGERREIREGGTTIIREPDRTIIREGNRTIIRHNEMDRFRYGAQDVRMERRGNENVAVVVRPGGYRVVTVTDDNGYLVRRTRIMPDGREYVLIDNRRHWGPGGPPPGPRGPGFGTGLAVGAAVGLGIGAVMLNLPPPEVRIPRERYIVETERADPALLYDTLTAPPVMAIERPYTLDEVRYNAPLRDRMPRVDLDTVTFESGSWELDPVQIQKLAGIADGLNRAIQANPQEVFLIEGHTDAVGNEVDNLSLSDRRAEAVAMVLTQQFGVPAENLTTQGYGEQYMKVPTDGPLRENRRVAVRRITPLLTGQAQAQPPQ
ncbi:outer membrane protein OmpA-like peptidoglycan-associated protein [Rhodoplanes tepidamans]|uniref:OmpA family protein n=1 Tax=Rhodoplanes tepidamans TaxID=200616 RepID=A0ABT5JEP0_RHOTP|nr:OmpA family protein [Rhodoplanes tepidamans]MDC7787744.1 OmpA family protein [Rhodoplanes tepidamans]MDQ0356668.1 outer membrane protein OmpA-like peptidoglycan-associated protein [Rhodoplanes tepidamans]